MNLKTFDVRVAQGAGFYSWYTKCALMVSTIFHKTFKT